MTRLDDTDTAAALEGAWPLPQPGQPVQFAGEEPPPQCHGAACAEHCRLQAELDSLRAHAAHLERQLLRLKSATANR